MKSKDARIGKGEVWAVVAAFSYALTNVILKWALADAPPLFGAAIKIVPIWAISAIVFISKGYYKKLNPRSNDYLGNLSLNLLIFSGVIVYVIGNWALFEALKKGAVAIATPIVGTQVIWATLISLIFLKEKINTPMIIGMVISLIGVVVLTIGNSEGNIMVDGWQMAVPLALISAISFAGSGSLKRYLFTRKSLDKWTIMFLEITTGLISLHMIFLVQGNHYYSIVPMDTILKFIFAGLFGAMAIFSMTTATSLTQVASATAINSTQTALAPVLAMLLLREKINFLMLAGIILIMGGVMLVQFKKPSQD